MGDRLRRTPTVAFAQGVHDLHRRQKRSLDHRHWALHRRGVETDGAKQGFVLSTDQTRSHHHAAGLAGSYSRTADLRKACTTDMAATQTAASVGPPIR